MSVSARNISEPAVWPTARHAKLLPSLLIASRLDRSAHIDVALPYELRALEGALHVAVAALEADTLDLEHSIGASLDNLDQRVQLHTDPAPNAQKVSSMRAMHHCLVVATMHAQAAQGIGHGAGSLPMRSSILVMQAQPGDMRLACGNCNAL